MTEKQTPLVFHLEKAGATNTCKNLQLKKAINTLQITACNVQMYTGTVHVTQPELLDHKFCIISLHNNPVARNSCILLGFC